MSDEQKDQAPPKTSEQLAAEVTELDKLFAEAMAALELARREIMMETVH
jgi:hypothetical protein